MQWGYLSICQTELASDRQAMEGLASILFFLFFPFRFVSFRCSPLRELCTEEGFHHDVVDGRVVSLRLVSLRFASPLQFL